MTIAETAQRKHWNDKKRIFTAYRYSCAYIRGLGGIKKNSTRIHSTADCIPVKV